MNVDEWKEYQVFFPTKIPTVVVRAENHKNALLCGLLRAGFIKYPAEAKITTSSSGSVLVRLLEDVSVDKKFNVKISWQQQN